MAERGVTLDHATLNRWVIKYSRAIAQTAKKMNHPGNPSWQTDETDIKIKGRWVYLFDKFGDALDFMLSELRDEEAATAFFRQAIDTNGFPDKVVMDKSGANYAGLENINALLFLFGWCWLIEIVIAFLDQLQIREAMDYLYLFFGLLCGSTPDQI